MPYVFQTKDRNGKPHPRYRFQYTDWEKRRRTALGTTGRSSTEKLALHVQTEQDAIRRGWKPAPKPSDTPRAAGSVIAEYLDWGRSQGGRGGHAWGVTHARMRKAHLKWWKDTLGLETLGDLTGSLPEVEKALRDLESDGKSGKTLQNYAESLAAFCDWSVSRGYLESDPLGELSKFDTSPRTRRRAMTGDEIIRLL